MAHIRTHDTTERRKNKVTQDVRGCVAWTRPGPVRPIYPGQPDHPRGRSDAPWRETYSARRATRRGPAPWPSRRGGELPFGYDARGWLDAQAVKVSQVKLMQRTVKLPPWPRQTT